MFVIVEVFEFSRLETLLTVDEFGFCVVLVLVVPLESELLAIFDWDEFAIFDWDAFETFDHSVLPVITGIRMTLERLGGGYLLEYYTEEKEKFLLLQQ